MNTLRLCQCVRSSVLEYANILLSANQANLIFPHTVQLYLCFGIAVDVRKSIVSLYTFRNE